MGRCGHGHICLVSTGVGCVLGSSCYSSGAILELMAGTLEASVWPYSMCKQTVSVRADGRRFADVLAGGVPDVAAAGALQLVRVVSLLVVYQQLLELAVVVMVSVLGASEASEENSLRETEDPVDGGVDFVPNSFFFFLEECVHMKHSCGFRSGGANSKRGGNGPQSVSEAP